MLFAQRSPDPTVPEKGAIQPFTLLSRFSTHPDGRRAYVDPSTFGRGAANMQYFIYVSLRGSSVPYLEPVFAETMEQATAIAVELMTAHPGATHADIFTDTGFAATVNAEPPAS